MRIDLRFLKPGADRHLEIGYKVRFLHELSETKCCGQPP